MKIQGIKISTIRPLKEYFLLWGLSPTDTPRGCYGGPQPNSRVLTSKLLAARPRCTTVRLVQLDLSDAGIDIKADGIFSQTTKNINPRMVCHQLDRPFGAYGCPTATILPGNCYPLKASAYASHDVVYLAWFNGGVRVNDVSGLSPSSRGGRLHSREPTAKTVPRAPPDRP